MRPVIIGIGGSHSGAGKTQVATLVLRTFRGWGAIKYTKTDFYASIVDDERVIAEEGKDTRKLLEAGAGKVLWVKSPFSELNELMPMAISMLSHLEGIVIEGNSAVETARPDIVIFVCGSGKSAKESAQRILRSADVVIFDTEKPPGVPRRAILLGRDNLGDLPRCLSGLVKRREKAAPRSH